MRTAHVFALTLLVYGFGPSVTSGFAQTSRSAVSIKGVDTNPCTVPAPCRTFAAAIAVTNPGGEVVVLESGGYGPVIINKSVAIIAPGGIHAAIAPSSGAAVIVDTGGGTVTLRNLWLTGQGADDGIVFLSGQSLIVENCVSSGFFFDGLFVSTVSSAEVFVSGSRMSGNDVGVEIRADGGVAFASLLNSRLEDNEWGIWAGDRSRVMMRDVIVAGSFNAGVLAQADTVATTAEVLLEQSVTSGNGFGISASGTSTSVVEVANSAITFNDTNLSVSAGNAVRTNGQNTVRFNAVTNLFTQTFAPSSDGQPVSTQSIASTDGMASTRHKAVPSRYAHR